MQDSAGHTSSVSGSPAGVRKPRKPRGRGLRTTTGCAICRKRHMKCDEIKPVCGPCAKGHRPCIYGVLPADGSLTREEAEQTPSQATVGSEQASNRDHEHSLSSASDTAPRSWPTPRGGEEMSILSPQSTYSNSTGYGTEVAPLRWFGLLAGDAANGSLDLPGLESLGDNALSQRWQAYPDGATGRDMQTSGQTPAAFAEGVALHNPAKLLQISALSPAPLNNGNGSIDERQYWQAPESVKLKDHEHAIFERFVKGISLWIDLFDPLRHFSSFVPHLALHNEGLMKALLALGARHMSLKPNEGAMPGQPDQTVERTAAVQYYYETLQYLQSAMRYTSYKNSLELLATVLIVSTYEMIDGAGKGWERHLKGVFWIQRSRDLNGESGGLEQAIWWAWLRQDFWAAFRERRRCFSFFKPTKAYNVMDQYDMASRVVYILAQAVNYSSDEEKQVGEADLTSRILRANALLGMLDEWRTSISIHFEPLPVEGPHARAFKPIWINPSAFGTSLQMYSFARILLLVHQPAAGGYLEYLSRDKIITESVETIGGIALCLTDDASRLISTQCLYAAGLYCNDDAKRSCILELITDHQNHTGWPVTDLTEELRSEWSKQKPG